MRDGGELLEWAVVHNNFYATPRRPVEEALAGGRDVLFDIDWQGTRQLKEMRDDVVRIFVLPPSMKELRARLERRAEDATTYHPAARQRARRNPALVGIRIRAGQPRPAARARRGAGDPRRRAPEARAPAGTGEVRRRASARKPSMRSLTRFARQTSAAAPAPRTRRRRSPPPAVSRMPARARSACASRPSVLRL